MLEALYDAAEMQAAEAGHDVPALMERAGRAVARQALARFPHADSFAVVCGAGANGGDGRIAARFLRDAGRQAVETTAVTDADVVVDALFGTGFRGPPRPEAAALIERINSAGAPVVSVDLPSGVDASTGETPGAAVRASLTVTFHGTKVGLAVAPGRFHAGEVAVADIGLEPAETLHRLVTRRILDAVPRRAVHDNKYSAGSVVVVGGSRGLGGAVCLAAAAAFRADAGYVAVAAPESGLSLVEQRVLEAVKRACPEDDEGRLTEAAADVVLELAERAGAVAIGPGLGRSDGTRALVGRLLRELEVPVVVDADALFELEPSDRVAPTVLTPHAGELARLVGKPSAWVSAHRLEALALAVERFDCIVLLKGADTLVGAP
ncbi:MAG: hypothetical protein H0V40_04270, partial [Actinobacteria bacterium]|nr:hypothetical protein [Actinomycetota bacterium]